MAVASFSASNRLYLEATGRPEVSISCSTSCLAGGRSLELLQTSENSARSCAIGWRHLGMSGQSGAVKTDGVEAEGEEDDGVEAEDEEDEVEAGLGWTLLRHRWTN